MSRSRAAERAAYMPAKPAPMMTSRMDFLLIAVRKTARDRAAALRAASGVGAGWGGTLVLRRDAACEQRSRRLAVAQDDGLRLISTPVLIGQAGTVSDHDGNGRLCRVHGVSRNFHLLARRRREANGQRESVQGRGREASAA